MGNEVGLSGSEGEREAEPREGEPGVLGAPSSGGLASHAGASSQLVMDAESGPSQVNAIATARGAYIQRVDGQLQNAWMERPIPVDLIARGVKGSVTVRFEIARGGRVSDVRLTGTSGNEWLDVLAFQVVPERLPRVPVDVPAPLLHEVTLHLR